MKTRIISAIVAIPIFLFFVIMGGYWMQFAITLLSLVGMYELYKAVSGGFKPVHIIGYVTGIIYIWCNNYLSNTLFVQCYILLAFILMLVIMIRFHSTININDVSITLLGIVYLVMTLYTAIPIREIGLKFIWLPFIYAWVSDTAAYFVGSAIGKHKLAPVLSPKKSVEGAVGAIIVTAIASAVYAYFTNFKMINEISLFFLFGAIGSVLGQVGDIAASTIKRYTGIKDYGNIMPGHGGVLDRFDSVLFTLPIVYLMINVLGVL